MGNISTIEYAKFIKLTSIVFSKEEDKNIKVKVRISPIHITSYVESVHFNSESLEYEPCTFVYCGGVGYNIDMKISEVDEMMDNIERSMIFNESE